MRIPDVATRNLQPPVRLRYRLWSVSQGPIIFPSVNIRPHTFEIKLGIPTLRYVTKSVEYRLRVEVETLEPDKAFHADTLGTLSQVSSITSYISLGSPKDMRR